ncbi:MAG: preprotein translocase subunit SecG [Candidatus Magasanikbacteria bacterium RIFOXYD2_FULL_39_9]|uniref:Protein-export membrane protein SecG n=1 Tax=Candidatus Magasanikbacteria bacterium RIFOXYD1_FULL_40_23 TaxID=1798705 RepID=A0A1F6P801_9BACT|nr:MAG: preprotein translocase subunit SecG [Candidatus Magasanikbacteria bacterium RIFOXYD1_FULL_40_23]OGH93491.1 MAG: preprotein translocase subunit SecG [Candidatus Magasanikbacteria bacterium RIFOXYD2_FULL_39_9]
MTTTIFNIIQFTLAALLVAAILLQQKGTGLSGVFGGSSNIYSTKRGVDKILHLATVVIAVVFFSASLIRLVL